MGQVETEHVYIDGDERKQGGGNGRNNGRNAW